MRCHEIQALLDPYSDGELAEETSQKVDRHLLRCPTCAYEARTLEQTRTMLRAALPAAEPSPAFRERTAARLLDALAAQLQPARNRDASRQWTLPFSREEQDGIPGT